VDEPRLLGQLRSLRADPAAAKDLARTGSYLAPRTLASLLAARAEHPDAQIVAGCTDVGLWVTKMHMQFGQVLDITGVEELGRVEQYDNHIAIGAAVTLTDAFDALVAQRPQLKTFANRFAGLPVRNAGTLGGNVANGSPIGDSMPLLIALRAHVVLMSVRGHREMPLENFYTGYRKNVLAPDEVLAWIKVPRPHAHPLPEIEGVIPAFTKGADARSPSPHRGERSEGPGWGEGQEFLRAYKISKRYDDDISAVCLVINMTMENGTVAKISIGAGGVAPTPARARSTEAFLLGRPWTQGTARDAIEHLRAEFQPIGDMRASAAYRSEVLGNLVQRFWLESQGLEHINLESAAWAVMPGSDPASMSDSWIAGQARNDNSGSTAWIAGQARNDNAGRSTA
jgi:xanthine dehydrogenase small subunit